MRTTFKWISIKATLPSGKVDSIRTSKRGRISRFIQRVKKLEPKEFELCVVYGHVIDNFGKNIVSKNSGTYKTDQELKHALSCFTEK